MQSMVHALSLTIMLFNKGCCYECVERFRCYCYFVYHHFIKCGSANQFVKSISHVSVKAEKSVKEFAK
jgi:hypothetical protein